MAKENFPGSPSAKKIREVRSHLRHYGITPQPALWRATWEWAWAVANSYILRPMWPRPAEIASQYVFLLLADMQRSVGLRLPFRARQQVPPSVQSLLGAAPAALPAPHEENTE